MGIQIWPVFGASGGDGGSAGLEWPDITIAPPITRYMDMFGGQWYAVYACMSETPGAVITLNQAQTADIYMISPGEAGKNGSNLSAGAGGGAGAPVTHAAVALPAGAYTLALTSAATSLTGDGVNLSAVTPAGGYPVGSLYRPFDDPNRDYGAVAAPVALSGSIPGTGAGGCAYSQAKAPDTVYGFSAVRVSGLAGSAGAGAGGNGGARTDYCYTYLQTLILPGPGAIGMILLRVRA